MTGTPFTGPTANESRLLSWCRVHPRALPGPDGVYGAVTAGAQSPIIPARNREVGWLAEPHTVRWGARGSQTQPATPPRSPGASRLPDHSGVSDDLCRQ
jgi:hypothetical protein